MGSPKSQREVQLDQQQVQDLASIQQQVVSYWQNNQRLPKNLSEIQNDLTYFQIPNPPKGRPAYEYTKTDDLRFSLCANFGVVSNEYGVVNMPMMYEVSGSDTNWAHNTGRTCFARTIDPNLIQPNPKPAPQYLD